MLLAMALGGKYGTYRLPTFVQLAGVLRAHLCVRRWAGICLSSTPFHQSVDVELWYHLVNCLFFVAHPLFSAILVAAAAISSSIFVSIQIL